MIDCGSTQLCHCICFSCGFVCVSVISLGAFLTVCVCVCVCVCVKWCQLARSLPCLHRQPFVTDHNISSALSLGLLSPASSLWKKNPSDRQFPECSVCSRSACSLKWAAAKNEKRISEKLFYGRNMKYILRNVSEIYDLEWLSVRAISVDGPPTAPPKHHGDPTETQMPK